MKKTYITRRALSILLTLAMLFSLTLTSVPALAADEGDAKDITVFFTSDIHGAFTGYNYATKGAQAGIGRIATTLNAQKTALGLTDPSQYVLIDVGDTIQGAGSSAFIGSSTWTFPTLEAFNYLHYDAVVLGNHEFNFGLPNMYLAYNGVDGGSNIGFQGAKLCGNAFVGTKPTSEDQITGSDPLLDGFASYFIKDIGGVKVAVIGMTNPSADNWDSQKLIDAGVYTEGAITATKRALQAIDANGGADVIVLAMHTSQGSEFGRTGSGADEILADSTIANRVDVFLGAHGHNRHTAVINGVKYGENGANGGSLGIVTIKATYESGKWVVKDKANTGVTVEMKNISNLDPAKGTVVAEDADYLAHMAPWDTEARAYAAQQIGTLTNGDMVPATYLPGLNRSYLEPTKLVSFINEVQTYYSGAQISGACPFNATVQHLEGPITRGSLIGIYNYDSNTVYELQMKGWQVKRWMEWAAAQYNAFNPDTDLTIPHSTSYLTDQFSGINYTVDISKPQFAVNGSGATATITETGQRINITAFTGNGGSVPFDMNATYTVAANDYRSNSKILSAGVMFSSAELAASDAPKILKTDCNKGLPIAPDIITLMGYYIQNVKSGVIDASDYAQNWKIIGPKWIEGESNYDAKMAVSRAEALLRANLPLGDTNRINYSNGTAIKVSDIADVNIFSFNDFHGTLDNSVSGSNPGSPKFVAYAKSQMAASTGATMILAAGDNYQGSAMSNLLNGEPVSKMMDILGVKYSALGNHEFDWGTGKFATWEAQGTTKFLCANIFDHGTTNLASFCRPYAVETLPNGIKVGIIGLATPSTADVVKADYIAPYDFSSDYAAIVNPLITTLKGQGCDLVIALTHLGAGQSGSNITGEVKALADACPTLDGIITGHTHSTVAGAINNIPVVQAAYNGRRLGKISFVLDDDHKIVNAVASTAAVPTATDAAVDTDMWNLLYGAGGTATAPMPGSYAAILKPQLDTVVGHFNRLVDSSSVSADWATQLVYDYIKRVKGSSYILVQNAGGWRSTGVSSDAPKRATDPVDMNYLFTLMPFDNEIVLMDMKGSDLLADLLNYQGTPALGSSPCYTGVYKNGNDWYLTETHQKVDPAATYKVACNDFMFATGANGLGGDNYNFTHGTNSSYMGVPLRNAMADQLTTRETLSGDTTFHSLSTEGGAVALVNGTYTYNVTVPESCTALTVTATVATGATYTISGNAGFQLNTPTDVTLRVIAANGAVQDYILTVTRTTGHMVIFNTMGGSSLESVLVDNGGKVGKPGDPTRSGYTFSGWYTNSACTALYNFSIPVTEDLTLYAGWTATSGTPGGGYYPGPSREEKPTFADTKGNWAATYIEALAKQGYVSGTGTGNYEPDRILTRAELTKVLYNAFGSGSHVSGPFADVEADAWYRDAVNWAFENGIVSGQSATQFAPNAPVTREQMAAMFARTAAKFGITLPSSGSNAKFADDDQISGYARDAVYALKAAGILSGKPGNLFDAKAGLTRGEMAKVMYYLLGMAGRFDIVSKVA